MPGREERASGLLLRRLDLTKWLEEARDQVRLQAAVREDPDAAVLEVRTGFPMAAHVSERGLHVVCGEGVGWLVTDEDPLVVGLFVSRPGFMAIAPAYEVMLPPDEVLRLATGGEVDLSDLVRQFGQRLEANFWLWYRLLAGAPTAADDAWMARP